MARGNPKGNPANLMPPWPKGVSGNPSGRPKRRPISDRYYVRAEEKLPDIIRKKLNTAGANLLKNATYGDALVASQFLSAIKGKSATFAQEIREAIEGKASQRIEITGAPGQDVLVGISARDLLMEKLTKLRASRKKRK